MNIAQLFIDVSDKPFPAEMEVFFSNKSIHSAARLKNADFANIKARKIYDESGKFWKTIINLY